MPCSRSTVVRAANILQTVGVDILTNVALKPTKVLSTLRVGIPVSCSFEIHQNLVNFSPIPDGPFQGCSQMEDGQKDKMAKSVYNNETWRKYLEWKHIKCMTHYLSFADISVFSPKISDFRYMKKYRYRFHFNT